MADTAAALVIQLSADFKQFQKEMRAATGVFDAEGRKIERRQKQLVSNLQKGFAGVGKFVVGGTALYALERYVSDLVDFGSKIKDVADATKIGTDEIQAFGLMASRNGVDQESFNQALEKFTKNMGDAAIKGGDLLKFYQKLGVSVKGDATQAFYQFSDAVAKTKDPTQQVALTTTALGKSAANLTPILAQGSKALKDQVEQLRATGQIASKDTISKLDDFGDAWTNLKRQFTVTGANAFADPLAELTKSLADPQVQSSLKTFATIMAELAISLAKVAKYAPIAAGAFAGAKVGRFLGPEGALAGAVIGGVAGGSIAGVNGQTDEQLRKQIASVSQRNGGRPGLSDKQEIARLQAILDQRTKEAAAARATAAAAAKQKPGAGGGTDNSDILGRDAQLLQAGRDELANLAKQDAKGVRDATLKANQDIRQDDQDTLESRIEAIRAQDDALLSATQGTEEYGKVQKEVIEETAHLDIELINQRKDADLQAIDERAKAARDADDDAIAARKRQLDELVSADKITPVQASSSLSEFEDAQRKERAQREEADASRRVALEQSTASQIVAINARKASDLRQYDGTDLVRDAITQGKEQIQQYHDETTALGLVAGEVARLTYVQGQLNEARQRGIDLSPQQIAAINAEGEAVGQAAQRAHDAQRDIQNGIQVADGLRSGLEDVFAAGLHGFGSLSDAANRFLEDMEEMILRLYVIKPLIESILGPSGSSLGSGGGGGGGGAAILTRLATLAAAFFDGGGPTGPGGKHQPAGIVHKGEDVFSQEDIRRAGGLHVVEAFRKTGGRGYASGGPVGVPSIMPSVPTIRAGQSTQNNGPVIYIDARYATKGVAEEIHDQLKTAYPVLVRAAVNETDKRFPLNLSNTLRDVG